MGADDMAAKPRRKGKLTDKEQSERFKETARMLETDETGMVFDLAFRRLLPPKIKNPRTVPKQR